MRANSAITTAALATPQRPVGTEVRSGSWTGLPRATVVSTSRAAPPARNEGAQCSTHAFGGPAGEVCASPRVRAPPPAPRPEPPQQPGPGRPAPRAAARAPGPEPATARKPDPGGPRRQATPRRGAPP